MRLLIIFLIMFLNIDRVYAEVGRMIPYKQSQYTCASAIKLSNVDEQYLDSVADQLGILGDCLFQDGKQDEALYQWLISASHGSAYGTEVAGVMMIAQAKNELDFVKGIALLRQLEKLTPDRFGVFLLYQGLSYLDGRFRDVNKKLAIRYLIKAVEKNSFEAAFFMAYLIHSGGISPADKSLGAEYWLSRAKNIRPDIEYGCFMYTAIESPAYKFWLHSFTLNGTLKAGCKNQEPN